MDLWSKILSASGLPECRSVAEHLCIGLDNGGDTIFIVRNPLRGQVQKVNDLIGVVKKINAIDGVINKISIFKGSVKKTSLIIGRVQKIENIKGDLKCQKT